MSNLNPSVHLEVHKAATADAKDRYDRALRIVLAHFEAITANPSAQPADAPHAHAQAYALPARCSEELEELGLCGQIEYGDAARWHSPPTRLRFATLTVEPERANDPVGHFVRFDLKAIAGTVDAARAALRDALAELAR